MAKNHLGRRSFKEQDAELEQNLNGMQDEIPEQPSRPTVHKRQPDKSSKDEPGPTV